MNKDKSESFAISLNDLTMFVYKDKKYATIVFFKIIDVSLSYISWFFNVNLLS